MANRSPLLSEDTAGAPTPLEPGSVVPGPTPGYYQVGAIGIAGVTAAVPGTIPLRDVDAGFEVGYLAVDTTPAVPQTGAPGKLVWNAVDGTLEFQLDGGNVTLQIGQETVLRVRNSEATPLVDGEVVYLTGSTGTHNTVLRADNTTEASSDRAIGLVTEPIGASPGEGYITTSGLVRGLNTNHLTEGALVYLGVAGATTATPPVAPAHQVIVGYCVKKSGGAGIIYVHVTAYPELSELHDVSIAAPIAGNLLVWDGTKWVNSNTIPKTTTLSDGANLELSGANALGEGNIVMKAAASAAFDTNLVISDSTAKTMGFICGATPGFAGAYGPFFGLRGITYAAFANQRGNIFLYGGKPAGPGAAEGRVIFGTNDTERLEILYGGDVKVKTGSLYVQQSVLVLPKTQNYGILLDTTTPTYGWRDILGPIIVKGIGANDPDWAVFRDTIRQYRWTNGNMREVWNIYHIPHDHVMGTDLYIHVHWDQNVVDTGGPAGVPGNVKWYFDISYSKGHGTPGGASDPSNAIITQSVVQQASTTQYGHMIAEVQFTNAGGDATHIDRARIEPDGLIKVRLYRDSTDVADTLNQDPFVGMTDVHYQSTNIGTKQKAPPFWT